MCVTGQYDRIVSQKVDVWSLGCILAEAAVWTVKGQLGLEDFKSQRMETNPGSEIPGCFHDGSKVLGIVDKTLKELIQYRRVSDPVTEGLVPLILKMFWRETSRPLAHDLWMEAKSILEMRKWVAPTLFNFPRPRDSISIDRPSYPQPADGVSVRGFTGWRDFSYDSDEQNAISTGQSPRASHPSLEDSRRSMSSLSMSSTRPSSMIYAEHGSPRAPKISTEGFQNSPKVSLHGRRPMIDMIRPGGLDKEVMVSSRKESLFSCIYQTPPDMRALEQLIELDIDVDERNENGQTPIMVAADMGDFRIVKLLLNKARLDVRDRLGQTLLHQIPKKNGGETMLEMILSHARVNSRHVEVNVAGIGGRTPLHEAVRTGKSKAIRLLIEHGANVNARDNRRTLPSTVAIEGDKVMALECLLKYDCEIDADKADPKHVSKDVKWMLKRYQKLPSKK
ncbi:MAG: Ankyrin-2 [Bathelium mastoideum]|nr:MAG: Ankyrin-2 [Bathelium mastoideum]